MGPGQGKQNTRGFTLIELCIVTVIAGILVAGAVQAYTVYLERHRISSTTENIETIAGAIASFRAENGFLPCPAPPTSEQALSGDCSAALPAGFDPASGYVSAETGAGGQRVRIGVVPITVRDASGQLRQLISGETAVDGWRNRLAYAVIESMAVNKAGYEAAGPGSIQLLATNGDTIDSQAKFIVLSRGEDGIGAYNTQGILKRACSGPSMDTENCNDDAIFRSIGLSGFRSTTGDSNNFDDFVLGDSSKGEVTCPTDQELRGFNFRTQEPVCVSRNLSCSVSDGAFVGISWVDDLSSPTGKKIVPQCRPFTSACNAGYVLASIDEGVPKCVRNQQGGCNTGYVQVGITQEGDEAKDNAFGKPVCAKISNQCPPNYVQVGVNDDLSARCAPRMANDTCKGSTVMIGNNPDGSPTCAAAPSCPAGQAMMGVNNGVPYCSMPLGSVYCPDGQVVKGIVNGNAVCGPISSGGGASPMPVYAVSLAYDYTRGDTPDSFNAEMDAAIETWPALAGLPDQRQQTKSWCFVAPNGAFTAIGMGEVMGDCLRMLCRYKTNHFAQLTELTGNCSTDGMNCGGAGRMGFGLSLSCFYSM